MWSRSISLCETAKLNVNCCEVYCTWLRGFPLRCGCMNLAIKSRIPNTNESIIILFQSSLKKKTWSYRKKNTIDSIIILSKSSFKKRLEITVERIQLTPIIILSQFSLKKRLEITVENAHSEPTCRAHGWIIRIKVKCKFQLRQQRFRAMCVTDSRTNQLNATQQPK